MLPLRHLYLIQNEYSNCRRSVYTLFAETSSKKRIECHISRQPLLVQVSQRLLHRYIPAGTSSLRRPPRTRVDDLLHRRRTPLLPLRRHSVAPSTYRGSRNDPSYIPVQSQSDAAPYKAAFLPAGHQQLTRGCPRWSFHHRSKEAALLSKHGAACVYALLIREVTGVLPKHSG